MQIKICGLTRPKEAQYLNAAGADYAGFVFHPPSRRNVTIEEAKVIMEALNPGIKKVAVMVSPEVATKMTISFPAASLEAETVSM